MAPRECFDLYGTQKNLITFLYNVSKFTQAAGYSIADS